MTATPIARRAPAAPVPREGGRARRRLVVRGVVQGVGFRPFVFSLAERLDLAGFVRNTSGGVVLEAEGDPGALDRLATALHAESPPLARIDDVTTTALRCRGDDGFRILTSEPVAGEYQPIAPDAATCDECLAELEDPDDRRYRYPFVNCTHCGPRFTIIEDIPYDRQLTTMRGFTMCARCQAEYENPRDRRFHAQPNACPECGPRLRLIDATGTEVDGDPVERAAAALRSGMIVAVKGLGGYQLACDASDAAAVTRLRRRKRRPTKPFAVMVTGLDQARDLCEVDPVAAATLSSSARPVTLLRRRDRRVGPAEEVGPGLDELGLMLPSTPLHHLVLAAAGRPLVMTSGNLSEEPIVRDDGEALDRLARVADLILMHDRPIAARYDDSVVRPVAGEVRVLRRARGLCPTPIDIREHGAHVLALGAQLKNTFCVLRDGRAFVGPHIGDLDHPLALAHQAEALETYLELFRVRPTVVACDLHPDLASTRLAERWWDGGAEAVRVQHHHAHVASVMAEHDLRGALIGVAWDGAGHGADGTVWGGELLVCDERAYRRAGHLAPVAQPGGDRAARQGWRMAAAYLEAAGAAGPERPEALSHGPGAPDARSWRLAGRVAAEPFAAPVTTSAGRLFDAVASLLGVAHESSYEGEAAIRLETLAGAGEVAAYPVAMAGDPLVLDTPALVRRLVADRAAGRPLAEVAAALHDSLAAAVVEACLRIASMTGLHRVALSGGVFQNARLLTSCLGGLARHGLEPHANRRVPANDGGVSLGQALVAAASASP